jgi:hypothetical protein
MTTPQLIALLTFVLIAPWLPYFVPALYSRAKTFRAPSLKTCIVIGIVMFACGMALTCGLAGYVIGSGGLPVIHWPTPPTPTPVDPVVVPSVKVLAVTYVWEKDKGGIPPGVRAALDKLNQQGIMATDFEEDTKNGNGETPAQYKMALAEAQKAGLPALVVQGEGNKVKTAKVTTEAETLEASKP